MNENTGVGCITGSNRVNRGGSFNNNAQNWRSANRNNNSPGNRNNNIGSRCASSPRRVMAAAHGRSPCAPVVIRAAAPRPDEGTKRTAGDDRTGHTAGPAPRPARPGQSLSHQSIREVAMRRLTTLTAILTLLVAFAATPAAANTAYSNIFTLDLRTTNPGAAAVKSALDDLEAAAIARIDRDRDELASALGYLLLVMDGKHGKEAIQRFLDGSTVTISQFDATVKYIFQGSPAAGDFADLGAGFVANLLVSWAINRAETAQAAYFRSVLSVYEGLWGTRDFATARAAIRSRLEQDYTHSGQTLGFAEAKRRIRSRIAALKAEIDRVQPGASFPGAELAAMVGIAAQSLRDSMNSESALLYYDGQAACWRMTLSGNSRYWASSAKALYESDRATQRFRFWRTVAVGGLVLGKTALAALTAAPTAGVSLGAWAITEKAVLASLIIGATWSTVSYEAANLENNRAAALLALDYLDSALGELSEIDATFTYRPGTNDPMVPAVDRLVRAYLSGQGAPLDGYALTVTSFTAPSQVTAGDRGLAYVEGTVTIRNSGTRAAAPSPLLLTNAWTGEGYHKVAVGDLGETRTLAPGQSHTFTWRSEVPLFSLVPSTLNLLLGFGPQLLRVAEEEDQHFLVLPPGSTETGGKISQVPVGVGQPGPQPSVYQHTPESTTRYVTYILDFAFGDLDLHVYDDRNRHQGMNYTTGSVESGIPGAIGPDPGANPESIRLPIVSGVTYRIEVVDRAAVGGATTVRAMQVSAADAGALAASVENSYRVVAIEEGARPAILDLSPVSRTTLHEEAQAEAELTFGVQEVGLHAPITGLDASVSPLVGAGGDTIPSGQVSVLLSKKGLEPGEYGEVRVVVPMSGRRAYPYQGTLTVTSSVGTKTASITIDSDAVRLDETVHGSARAFLIPSSGHTAGAGGTVWRSDAVVHNPGSAEVTAHLFFMKRDQSNASTRGKRVSIAAGASVKLEDLVLALFGENATSGAILVASDADLIVTSRTFNNAASGTYGQYIEGYPLSQAIGPNQPVRLIQLTKNANYRTNIGVANASGEEITVTVDIYRANGSKLGTRTYTVQPYGYYQENNPINTLTSTNVDDAYAVVSSATPGAKYFTYASVIDNRTGDPIQVVPAAVASEPIFLPAAARVAGLGGTNWRSDLQLHNPGATAAAYSIALLKRDQANSSPVTKSYTLGPGQSVRYNDVVGSVFGATGAAALRITPTSGTISATMRTYNDQASGTYGQFIAGLPASAAIVFGQQARVVQLSQSASTNSGFRTNLGLLNASGGTTVVEIRLYRGDGALVGTTSRSLQAYAFYQIDRIFAEFTAAEIADGFAVLSTPTRGGAFFAYASVVDNRSGDPITVPARAIGAGVQGGSDLTLDHNQNAILLDSLPQAVGRSALPAGSFTATVSGTGNLGRSDLPTHVACLYKNAAGQLRAAAMRFGESVSDVAGGHPFWCVIPDWIDAADNTGTARVTLTGGGQTITLDLDAKSNCVLLDALSEAVIKENPASSFAVSSTGNLGTSLLAPHTLVLFKEQATGHLRASVVRAGDTLSGVQGTSRLVAVVLDWINKADNTGQTKLTAGGGGAANEITVMLPGNVPLELVRIPAGTFTMGAPWSERGWISDETQHQVTISQDYYMGKYEVTQRQWEAVMGTPMRTSCGRWGIGDNYPVYCLTWDEVCGGATGSSCTSTSFIGKLNAHLAATGQPGAGKFRLPTEAEWERAARGGTTGTFSFDTSANPSWDMDCGSFPQAEAYMWWCNNSGNSTHPVGQKLPNPYGLFNMHGNVSEWVADWYSSSYYASSPSVDPQGPSSGSLRVMRGGSWYDRARSCRSACRTKGQPVFYISHTVGFRLARSQ